MTWCLRVTRGWYSEVEVLLTTEDHDRAFEAAWAFYEKYPRGSFTLTAEEGDTLHVVFKNGQTLAGFERMADVYRFLNIVSRPWGIEPRDVYTSEMIYLPRTPPPPRTLWQRLLRDFL